ncbi:hypothetical protein HK101_002721, partial [Irineochytrium annulatum]
SYENGQFNIFVPDYIPDPAQPTITVTLDDHYAGLPYRYKYTSTQPVDYYTRGTVTEAIIGILPTYSADPKYTPTVFDGAPTPVPATSPRPDIQRRGGNAKTLIPMFIDGAFNIDFAYTKLRTTATAGGFVVNDVAATEAAAAPIATPAAAVVATPV